MSNFDPSSLDPATAQSLVAPPDTTAGDRETGGSFTPDLSGQIPNYVSGYQTPQSILSSVYSKAYSGPTGTILRDQNTAQAARLKMLLDAVPELANTPQVATQLAQTNLSDGDLLKSALDASTRVKVASYGQELTGQPHSVQVSLWANMTPQRQQVLQMVGYQDPTKTKPKQNWWDKGFHIPFTDVNIAPGKSMGFVGALLDGAANVVTSPFNAMKTGAEDTLHVAGAPLRAVQHLYRAAGVTDSEYGQEQQKFRIAGTAALVSEALGREVTPTEAQQIATGQAAGDVADAYRRVIGTSPDDPNAGAAVDKALKAKGFGSEVTHYGGGLFGFGNFGKAWDDTSSGEKFLMAGEEANALETLGYSLDKLSLAKMMATASDPASAIDSVVRNQGIAVTDPNYIKTFQKVADELNDPSMQKAIAGLRGAHASFGRDVARAVNLDPQVGAGRVVSGAGDAVFDWFGDPLMIGAKYVHGVDAAKGLVSTADEVSALGDIAKGLRTGERAGVLDHMGQPSAMFNTMRAKQFDDAFQFIADKFSAIKAAPGTDEAGQATKDLFRMFPKIRRGMDDLNMADAAMRADPNIGHGIQSADDLWKYWSDQQNFTRMFAGRGGGQAVNGVLGTLPSMGPGDWARYFLKSAAGDTINWAADNGLPGIKWASRTLQMMGSKVPLDSYIHLIGPDAVPDAEKAFAYGISAQMPTAERWNYLSNFIAGTDGAELGVAGRRNLVQNFLTDIGTRLGMVGGTPAGDYLNDIVTKSQQLYSPNAAGDLVQVGDNLAHTGWLPVEHSSLGISFPRFRDFTAQAAKVGDLSNLGLLNNGLVDGFMSHFWRPAMLLRPGFAFRVGGDEMLNFMLSHSPQSLLQAGLATNIASQTSQADRAASLFGEHANMLVDEFGHDAVLKNLTGRGQDLVNLIKQEGRQQFDQLAPFRPFTRAAQMVQDYLPGLKPTTVGDFLASRGTAADLAANFATNAFRGLEKLAVPDELLANAQRMMNDPTVSRVYAEMISGKHGANWNLNPLQRDDTYTIRVGNEPVSMQAVRGEYKDYPRVALSPGDNPDPNFTFMLTHRLDEAASDPVGRAALDAARGYVGHGDDYALRAFGQQFGLEGDTGVAVAQRLRDLRQSLTDPELQRLFDDAVRLGPDSGSGARVATKFKSELAKAVNSGAVDPEAKVLGQVLDNLDQGPMHLITSPRDPWDDVLNTGKLHDRMMAAARDKLYSPELADFTSDMVRGRQMPGGTPVATPPGENARPVHVVMIHRNRIDDVASALQSSAPEATSVAQRLTQERGSLAALDVASQRADMDSLRRLAQTRPDLDYLPLSPNGFGHFDDANLAADLLNQKMQALVPELPEVEQPKVGVFTKPMGNRFVSGYGGVRRYDPNLDVAGVVIDPEVARQLKGDVINVPEHLADHIQTIQPGITPVAFFDRFGRPVTANGQEAAFASPGVHFKDAIDAWSHTVADNLMTLVGRNGDAMPELVEPALDNPKLADFMRNKMRLPDVVTGPQLHVPTSTLYNRIVDAGFNRVISPMINAMIRQPRFLVAYTDAAKMVQPAYEAAIDGTQGLRELVGGLNATKPMAHTLSDLGAAHDLAAGDNEAWLNHVAQLFPKANLSEEEATHLGDVVAGFRNTIQHFDDVTLENAVENTIPYIHDARIRSQFHEFTRNLIPFQFAEEQFLRRWARVLAAKPEAIRQAQLYMGGLRNIGVVHKDASGNDVFSYPGVPLVQKLVSDASTHFFGAPAQIPLSVPWSGTVKSAIPGLSSNGLAGFGPFVTVPLAFLGNQYPEINAASSSLEGGYANKGVLGQLVPSWAQDAYHAISADPGRIASMSIQAMQAMEAEAGKLRAQAATEKDPAKAQDLYNRANELSPPTETDAVTRQKYLDTVRNWSRTMLITQAFTRAVGPTVARPEFPTQLKDQLNALIKTGMPIGEALSEFLREHPEGDPYTVFETTRPSGAPLSPTDKVMQWMTDNQATLARYPMAGPWLAPEDSNGTYSSQAFNQQVATGLRQARTPQQWLDAYWFKAAAPAYFDEKARVEGQLAKVADPIQKDLISKQWSTWKAAYEAQHPSFANQLARPDAQQRRQAVLGDMRKAVNDPDLASTPQTAQYKLLINGLDTYNEAMAQLKQDNRAFAAQRRTKIQKQWDQWTTQELLSHPEVSTFYYGIIAPEVAASSQTVRSAAA